MEPRREVLSFLGSDRILTDSPMSRRKKQRKGRDIDAGCQEYFSFPFLIGPGQGADRKVLGQ